mgnify:CR=1 FL=1
MNKQIPLVVEPYPDDYDGYKFITLIRYNDSNTLNIIDNVVNGSINTYVLDLCSPSFVEEERIIEVAYDWFESDRIRHPISVEFSRLGLADEFGKIFRTFPIDYVARVIGPLPEYRMTGAYKIRKRKKKNVPENIEIIRKTLADQ